MTASVNKRPAAIRVVIPFVFRHWLNQPVGAATVAGGLLGATAADLFMPLFSGHLVDAVTLGASDPAARRLYARAALLDRLARQQLCRLDRAQDHPRHVGARSAQRHHSDGAIAVAGGAARLDDPARIALAVARPRHRGWFAGLCVDDGGVLDPLYRAGGAH